MDDEKAKRIAAKIEAKLIEKALNYPSLWYTPSWNIHVPSKRGPDLGVRICNCV